MEIVQRMAGTPVGGRLQYFVGNWERISKDPWIRETVIGARVEFRSTPVQRRSPGEGQMNSQKSEALTREVEKLAEKQAIVRAPMEGGFTSTVFLVPKSDGTWRPVINLQNLNRHVITHHFKMESIRSVKGLIQEGDWLLKLDLKDAYLTVPICPDHQDFLKFQWQGQIWKFQSLPFGLSSAPQMFTKLMKPIVALWRRLGIRFIMYLDDMLIMARTQEESRQHLATIVKVLMALGFIINLSKSITTPTQRLVFLGFTLDSCKMTISLPGSKLHALRKLARKMMKKKEATIQELARLLGTMVAAQPAILPAPLYYRHLERMKSQSLRKGHSYESQVEITPEMRMELQWWSGESCHHNGRPLRIKQWDMTIESDASKMGWGAFSQEKSTGGPWTPQEKLHSINYLELLAAFLALKSFVTTRGVTVLLRMDNISAIAFLNRMGGTHSKLLSDLAVEIWKWCLARDVFIHAEHLPGVENTRADWESRHVEESGDWMLDRQIFQQLDRSLGPFTVDLFASRTNAQLPQYCSWRPDPEAWCVDAFMVTWATQFPYMFPPFILIPQCLSKMRAEQASGVLIAPVWPNQVWFPQLLRHLQDFPVLLPPTEDIVTAPDGTNHPMAMSGHLPLAAWPISGNPTVLRVFQTELLTSSEGHGDLPQSQPIHPLGDSGIAGVLNGTLIPFRHL